jgi:hypothetical protein
MGPPFLANVGANSSFIIPIPRVYGAYIYIYNTYVYIYNGVYEVTKTTQEHLLTKKQKNWLHPYPAAPPSAMYIFPKPFAANMATCSTRVQTRLLRELARVFG